MCDGDGITANHSRQRGGPIKAKQVFRWRSGAVIVAGVVALALVIPQGTSAASTADTCPPTPNTSSWSAAVTQAQAALTAVINNIQNQNYGQAVTNLHTLRHQVRKAHTGATELIGVPPQGEQEDPPGVKAVLKVVALEHTVTMKLIPLFNGLDRADVVDSLGTTLNVNVACRDVMLRAVIALRPGQRSDYSDGLSDTLPDYKQELSLAATALSNYDLTADGRAAIKSAQAVITETQAAMKKAFGGGE